MLFLIKIGFSFKNPLVSSKQQNGLTYSDNATVGELVNKDTDGDGIPDWEEALYGLDPTKKETTPGIPDSVALEKLISENQTVQGTPVVKGPENLTQTAKFSQDLMATVTSLSQNGAMDQTTADALSNTLVQQIENTPPRKVFLLTDFKIINDNTYTSIKKYADSFAAILQKNPTPSTIPDILQRFSADPNNVDSSVLAQLDPNIKQISSFIDGMVKMNVPQYLEFIHLSILNDFEKIVENLNDVKLYDTDPIVALGGMTKYSQNSSTLLSDIGKLSSVINQKLKP